MDNPELLMKIQRRSDGKQKDMEQTSGTPANDEKMTHVSNRMLNKDNIRQFHPWDTPTEPPISSTPETQSEYLAEEERMESDSRFAENSSTANASSKVVNQDSIKIPDDSAPINQLENDEKR